MIEKNKKAIFLDNKNQLTTYSYTSNHLCFEYFIGYEIISLLGYKNLSNILKNVSKSNQLVFRDYPGKKEPKLDPRTILITHDGAIEIIRKTHKHISPDVSHILNKFNLLESEEFEKSKDIEVEENKDKNIKVEENKKILLSEFENKLTIYSYTSNHLCFEYFIGYEIASLLGYKSPQSTITKNVSKSNKLIFIDYPGVKIPNLDPKTILITRDGAIEIIRKTRKHISPNVSHILNKFNLLENKIKSKDIEVEKNKKILLSEYENELSTYSYFSNYLCFEYFVGYEIASLLGYKSPQSTITKNVSKSNQLVFKDYPGEKIPNLDPRTILITRDGAIEIILKTRKRISPDVLHILKAFNIDTTNKKCLTKEQQTLSSITNAFKTENFEDQFKVDMYYLDLYFPDYKLVIECDENGHSDRKPYNERERMDYVNKKFNIDDTNWIRYNPDEYDFDISKVFGKIYRKIDEIKRIENKYIKKNTSKEQTISEILNIFNDEELIEKFKIEKMYELELYFPKYKIIVQSENEYMNPEVEVTRENYINKFLKIDNSYWIKYNLHEENFDTSKVIGQIYKLIKEREKEVYIKRCCTCRKEKLTNQFYRNKSSQDGFEIRCIECKKQNAHSTKVQKEKEIPDNKICPQCDTEKSFSEYWKNPTRKDGLCNICKSCSKEMDQKISNSDKIVEEFKTCSTCKVIKITEKDFHKRKKSIDGYTGVCKKCSNVRSKISSSKIINSEKVINEFTECIKCMNIKKTDKNFRKIKRNISGHSSICISCTAPDQHICVNDT